MNNIWILNHYATDMFYNKGGRHYAFAKYLKRAGYDPVIFSCNTKHNSPERFVETDALWTEHLAQEIDVPFVFVKSNVYTGNGIKRILNMLGFYFNVKKTARQYAVKKGKPDIIYASSVHPLTLVAGIQLAKRFGVKCICEVRDLWPESIVTYGLLPCGSPIVKLLYRMERWIYAKADAVIFTMEGGRDYIIEKGWDKAHGGPIDVGKVYHINNGVDLEVFDYNREHNTLADADIDDTNTFKAIYTGSVRLVNHLATLVDAAEELQRSGRTAVRILIYGDGTERETLEKEAAHRGLNNIIFKGAVEKKYVPYVLSKCDLNLMHGQTDVNAIARFGASLNKSFEYLASSKPTLGNFSFNYNYIEGNGCGVCKPLVSSKEYADAIASFRDMPKQQYDAMCKNARRAAMEYDFKVLTHRLAQIIDAMNG